MRLRLCKASGSELAELTAQGHLWLIHTPCKLQWERYSVTCLGSTAGSPAGQAPSGPHPHQGCFAVWALGPELISIIVLAILLFCLQWPSLVRSAQRPL